MSNRNKDSDFAWKPPKWLRDARLLGAFIILIFALPFILTNKWFYIIDLSDTGQIGDTIGGIMGPMVALIASILTYMAFYEQYKSNEYTRRQFLLGQYDMQFERYNKVKDQIIDKLNISSEINGTSCFDLWDNELKNIQMIIELSLPLSSIQSDNAKRQYYHKVENLALEIFWNRGYNHVVSYMIISNLYEESYDISLVLKEIESNINKVKLRTYGLGGNAGRQTIIIDSAIHGKKTKVIARHSYFDVPLKALRDWEVILNNIFDLISNKMMREEMDVFFYKSIFEISFTQSMKNIYSARLRNTDNSIAQRGFRIYDRIA